MILATPFLHRADTAHDYWRFTEHGLRELLKTAGFEVLWLKAQGHALCVVVNILKYAIYIQPRNWIRRMLGLIGKPWFHLFERLDAPLARSQPILSTYTTGYLIRARGSVKP